MSAINDCPKYVIVPNDPNKPVVGVLIAAHGKSWEYFESLAEALGLKPGEYQIREFLSEDSLYDDKGNLKKEFIPL